MKIAIYNLTTTTKAGGVESFTLGIACALAKRGHTVHIHGGRAVGGENIVETVHGQMECVTVFTYPYLNRRYVPNFGTRFRKFVERLSLSIFALVPLIRGKYDIIYIHKPYDLPVALLVAAISGAKAVFNSHGTEFFPGYRWMVKRLYRFFSCSTYNAIDVRLYTSIRPIVLYNGIDTERFRPLSRSKELIKRHSLNGQHILISICRLVGWKGLQYAIAALPHIDKSLSIKYFIGGEGPYENTLRQLAADLGVADKVVFLGRLPNAEIPAYYSIADVALYPSVADETFGISIAEAMSCGMPVVAGNIGGILEVVGDSGLLIPPKDELAIAKAVNTLLMDNELRQRLGISACDRVSHNFNWDMIAERFEQEIGVISDA
ncbi:glycosyltransferase family 4 protein [Candidatus Magnetominusculus dajiuhuensis]|uniref:glycosyltransferase family 4 protein n=1 Tax=Candidatus Magnetominusculus dajiuhuensis TaxID=3137712 RepID=UPI003B43AC01